MTRLTLDLAQTIIAKARETARGQGHPPLTYAVVDTGGHVVAMAREDGAGFMRVEIALGKAWGCFALEYSSRTLAEKAKAAPAFSTAISGASGGRLIPSPGGVVIRDAAGTALGAFGISGSSGDIDEAVAIAAIEAAGLKADAS